MTSYVGEDGEVKGPSGIPSRGWVEHRPISLGGSQLPKLLWPLEHLECVLQSRSPVCLAKKLEQLRVGDIGLRSPQCCTDYADRAPACPWANWNISGRLENLLFEGPPRMAFEFEFFVHETPSMLRAMSCVRVRICSCVLVDVSARVSGAFVEAFVVANLRVGV
eukprot:1474871-Prymnesium_polylepis.4